MKNYREKWGKKLEKNIKRHVGNDNSIAFNDTCDHAPPTLLLPTFCVSATHAINLTKGITHISSTHTHTLRRVPSHVQGQSNKRRLPSCHAFFNALGQLQGERRRKRVGKRKRKRKKLPQLCEWHLNFCENFLIPNSVFVVVVATATAAASVVVVG